MGGLERVRNGEISTVLLGNKRIPDAMTTIKKSGGYVSNLRKFREVNDYFPVRDVGSLWGMPFLVSRIEGLILFGREKTNGFTQTEREMLQTYSDAMNSWMRQSYHLEKLMGHPSVENKEVIQEKVLSEGTDGQQVKADLEGRLQNLEVENRQLKEELDQQVRVNTQEMKQTIMSLMDRESELDQQVFERLAAVELGQAVTMLFDLDLILDIILDVVCETLSVESASIMLLREDKGDLVVHAYRGLQDEVAKKTRLLVGEAIAGYVAQQGEPLLIEDIEQDPRFVPFRRERYRSGTLLSVPILHEGKVVGVINLADPKREGPFLPRDLDVLQALSRQAAIAIINHRLYQEFENGEWIRKTYEERLIRELSGKVMQESQILEKIEGEYQVSILSVHLHEDIHTRERLGVRERIQRIEDYLQEIREVILRHQGDVAGDTGAGIFGVFGLPFPDGSDSWRAVLAAVDLLKIFTRYNQKTSLPETNSVGVSVGVATGELLLRHKKGTIPYGVFGEAWERAVILMQASSHGQILVDEETHEKVQHRVHSLRLVLPYGVHKKMTVYGIKGLKRMDAEEGVVAQGRSGKK
jgi:class 3 adenylate cyclase/putative methionine-R-sulfoxide reductase with GAF domain